MAVRPPEFRISRDQVDLPLPLLQETGIININDFLVRRQYSTSSGDKKDYSILDCIILEIFNKKYTTDEKYRFVSLGHGNIVDLRDDLHFTF